MPKKDNNNEEREDVQIAGSGTISGGNYESVRVAGSGKVDGDLRAKRVETAGSAEIKGNVSTEELKTAGTCKVRGWVKAGEVKTSGTCKVEEEIEADLFRCAGSQTVGGDLTAKYARIAGSCKVGGDVQVDKFVSRGSFRIKGLLSADEIEVRLGGDCAVKEIGGEKIVVQRKGIQGLNIDFSGEGLKKGLENLGGKLDKLGERFGVDIEVDSEKLSQEIGKIGETIKTHVGGWGSGTLTAELIEGDDVYLEWTKADTVRGNRVKIGEGCEIERVEYYEELEVDEKAEVEERIKL